MSKPILVAPVTTAYVNPESNEQHPGKAVPETLGEATERPRLARSRVYRVLCVMLAPVFVFCGLEAALRVAGYGYPTRFLQLKTRNGQRVYEQNNQVAWRFLGPRLSRLPYALSIPQVKPARTVRVFVFGESAAYGDPSSPFGLPRLLQAQLSLRHPGVRFEVENAAMTGINSHAILPIARDCVRADGDIWVVYLGNNEVVGPFGAGTIFGPQVPPLPLIEASLAVKSTRTGELLDQLSDRLVRDNSTARNWGGMAMFLGQTVPADDPRMSRVYAHFEHNLGKILDAARRARTAVVLSTVAVNLRDCPPLASGHQASLSPAQLASWNQQYQSGVEAQNAGSNSLAAEWFAKAAAIDNQHAELRYRQGQCALAAGNLPEARTQFAAARDLDQLRFRCDSRLNEVTRRVAARHAGERVLLADAECAFNEHSPDAAPGERWFYEHVHLTFEGNYLLSRTIAEKVEVLLPDWARGDGADRNAAWPSLEECARRLAWSDFNQSEALRQMLGRISQPPFTAQFNHHLHLGRMRSALESLAPAREPEGISNAIQICSRALARAPDEPELHAQMTMLKMTLGDFAGAFEHAQRQTQLLPNNPVGWFHLGMIHLQQHRLSQAIASFDKAIEADPHNVASMVNRANVLILLRQTEAARREYRRALRIQPGFCLAWMMLGRTYEMTGDRTEAEKCYKAAVERNSDIAQSSVLAGFCQSRGWLQAAATHYATALRLDPVNYELLIAAGKNLADLQRPGPAAQLFLRAARLKPALPEPYLCLGTVLMQQNMYDDAAAQFEKVLQLDPHNTTAAQYVALTGRPRQYSPDW